MVYHCVNLKDYNNFMAINDGIKINYGGYQKWFKDEINRKYGCSAIAATNLILYKQDNLNFKEYTNVMENICEYLPIREKVGILKVKEFEEGIKNYGLKIGKKLRVRHCYFHISYEGLKEFIKKALSLDKPLALLILNNSKIPEFQYHWVTITKYISYGKSDFIGVSSWGESRMLNVLDVYKYSSYGAAIYIE